MFVIGAFACFVFSRRNSTNPKQNTQHIVFCCICCMLCCFCGFGDLREEIRVVSKVLRAGSRARPANPRYFLPRDTKTKPRNKCLLLQSFVLFASHVLFLFVRKHIKTNTERTYCYKVTRLGKFWPFWRNPCGEQCVAQGWLQSQGRAANIFKAWDTSAML